MVTREIILGNFSKIDASPAAMLVQLASKFDSSIHVDQAEKRTNAKSIMGVMILKFVEGETVTVTAGTIAGTATITAITAIVIRNQLKYISIAINYKQCDKNSPKLQKNYGVCF